MHSEPAQNSHGIGIILLAAGASSRLGQPKQLLTVKHTTLIRQMVEITIDADFNPIAVVLGAHKDRIASHIRDLPVEVVENDFWQKGMGTSIRVGLQRLLAINPNTKAVILMLCDQPFVDTHLLHNLTQIYQSSGNPIVASQYNEILGVPALFDQQFFSHLTALQGDQGARKIIRQFADVVKTIPFEKGKYDIDTMDDFQKLQQMLNK